ncbi:MAG: ribose-phosphate diphosphokinase [Gammaproteobacteria bacterium]|nr:ribose-phosphate diphosphokinase [Gammaproteobacteria bacterium]
MTTRTDINALVLGFPSYREPARRLAVAAGLDYADVTVHRFPDGESLVRLPAGLPCRVILCCSLDHPNTKLVELELAAATAPRLGARWLTLVAPYLCYMRQDKAFHPGEAVSQQVIGALLARHFDTVITVDPHLHRTHDLHQAIPVRRAVALSATPVMAEWIADHYRQALLMGPDEESLQWVRAIATSCDLDYGVARKQRLGDHDVRVELPNLPVAGRSVVLVDDVASTGHSLAETARQLKERGAASVTALVTHALFVGHALERLREAGVSDICSTDSVLHASNKLSLDILLAAALEEESTG